jgi:hypothetical protein
MKVAWGNFAVQDLIDAAKMYAFVPLEICR